MQPQDLNSYFKIYFQFTFAPCFIYLYNIPQEGTLFKNKIKFEEGSNPQI